MPKELQQKISDVPDSPDAPKVWGRFNNGNDVTAIVGTLGIILFCPTIVLFYWSTLTNFDGSIIAALNFFFQHPVWYLTSQFFPSFSLNSFAIYATWILTQALLYAYLPCPNLSFGQTTPGGNRLAYKTNGLIAYIISHVAFVVFSAIGVIPATLIYDHWPGLLISANIYGYSLSIFSYIKAHYFPTHPEDRQFSGNKIYDFFMGIELNPRFGKLWDFKLFHNGRIGIILWTLINLSFAAAQFKIHGTVTNSMILLNLFHFLYVIDFFYNEDWYLRTIDIAHDHFGFYLAWGDSVWLPFMYTLQSHYLVRNPVNLSLFELLGTLAIGVTGYWIFRGTNHQKDLVRAKKGDCQIWGKPAQFIKANYSSSDGKAHESILLTSGFWGLSRHFNYVGDLLISLAMCMTCGFTHVLPYFYIIYMTILLLHRINRDNTRCQNKYGKYWDQFCKEVPYKLVPYVY